MEPQVLGIITNEKVILLGSNYVGKSCVGHRVTRNEFDPIYDATFGVHEQIVKLDIWDMAGNEKYDVISRACFRGARAAVVVYDITDAKTFDRAVSWIEELRQKAPDMMIVLAGNKLDLAAERRAVQTEEANAFAEKHGLTFTECSAKSGHAVNEMFLMIAHTFIERQITPSKNKRTFLTLCRIKRAFFECLTC